MGEGKQTQSEMRRKMESELEIVTLNNSLSWLASSP